MARGQEDKIKDKRPRGQKKHERSRGQNKKQEAKRTK
jgi:hypothetical protein